MSSEEVRRLVLDRAERALNAEYGGVLVGGAKKKKKKVKEVKKVKKSIYDKNDEWNGYWQRYAKLNGLSPKEAMCAAAPSYRQYSGKPKKKLSVSCKNALDGKKYARNDKKFNDKDVLEFLLNKYFKE